MAQSRVIFLRSAIDQKQETKGLLCGQSNNWSLSSNRVGSVGEAILQTSDKSSYPTTGSLPQPFLPGSRMAAVRLMSPGRRMQGPFPKKIKV